MTLGDLLGKLERRIRLRLRENDTYEICECNSDSIVVDKFKDWLVVDFYVYVIHAECLKAGMEVKIKEDVPF